MKESDTNKKYEIRICLGSACFSRGNRNLLGVINKFIKDYNLEEKTDFRGKQCLDLCSKGPVLSINGEIYEEVSEENIIEILKRAFEKELFFA